MFKTSIITLMLFLSGCAWVTYEAKPDGSTYVEGISFGVNRVLDGVIFETNKDGSRRLKIEGYNENQVEGIRRINEGLSLIVEGAAKGAF